MASAGETGAEEREALELMERVKAGDGAALESLYRLYGPPLFEFVRGIVGNREAAEEVLQDVFIRIYRKAERFDGRLGTPFSFLATMARRLAIDRLRQRGRRPKLVALEGEQDEAARDQPKDESRPAYQQVEAAWLRDYFRGLPERQREVLGRAFFGGYSQREIAEQLQLPLGTVKSDMRRGLESLRQRAREP